MRKLEISALLFREVESDEPALNSQEPAYPRKHARLQFAQPLDRIRDLRLPKKLELEKRKVNLKHENIFVIFFEEGWGDFWFLIAGGVQEVGAFWFDFKFLCF